ncbi:MAG TPA: RodZ domain-containing protein [Bacteroidota bacterium]|nr:RodZ domain-containing protein [Bacteroidota bacterium]
MGAASDTGKTLKEARVKAGRTLEDLARATRIHIKYLSEIEEGTDFSLPAVYRRTFVRTCARELGLDPDDLPTDEPAEASGAETARPRSVLSELSDQPPVEKGVTSPVSSNPFAEKSQIRTMAVVVILLVTALVMSVKWLGSDGDEPGAAQFRDDGSDSSGQDARIRAFARDSGGALHSGRTGPVDSLVLRATTTESVWVHIVIDNDSAVEYTLPPRYALTLRARENFLLAVGNPAGISISLNGRKMDVLGDGSRPRKNIFLSRKSLPD